jgi:hypothetical protein
MPTCATYLGALESSLIKSYDQTFLVMLGLMAVAFLFVLFLKGRLPKTAPKDAADTKPGPEGKTQPSDPQVQVPAAP